MDQNKPLPLEFEMSAFGFLVIGTALALKLFERMKQLARSETNWNAKGSVRRWVGDTHQNGFGHDLSPK